MTDPMADHLNIDKIDDNFGTGSGDQTTLDEDGLVFGVEPVHGGIRDVANLEVEDALVDSGPEVRDHRGEDPSLPPGDHDDSDGDPIIRDHRDGPLDDFQFHFGL